MDRTRLLAAGWVMPGKLARRTAQLDPRRSSSTPRSGTRWARVPAVTRPCQSLVLITPAYVARCCRRPAAASAGRAAAASPATARTR
ncbi:hypothetical protein STENM223S_04071 [Streptomyces tendae]